MVRSNADFIPLLASKTARLRELTKKYVPFVWTQDHEQEFLSLRESFRKEVALSFFSTDKPTFVVVDASPHGLGAMLLQGDVIDRAKLVALVSRATTPTESRYPQLDLEALGVDFGLRRFRQYLVGGPEVTVYTDHQPLVPIFAKTRIGSLRTDRIMLRNQDVSYKVTYREGKLNCSDYLSRHPTPLEKIKNIDEETHEMEKLVFCLMNNRYVHAMDMQEIHRATQSSRLLQRLINALKNGWEIKNDRDLKLFNKVYSELTVIDGIIYRGQKILLPTDLQEKAVLLAHQGAHPGMARMKARVRSSFWFPQMDQIIEDYVRSCHECQIYTNKITRNPLTSAPLPDNPWENVSLDLFGPMPRGDHVLVARDNFSRFPAAELVKSTSSKHVLPALGRMYDTYGNPLVHKTDSGPPFNSNNFSRFSGERNIVHKLTPPLHPQANEAEVFMKPLGKCMKIAHFNKSSKQKALDTLLESYRKTPHPSTGVVPEIAMQKDRLTEPIRQNIL